MVEKIELPLQIRNDPEVRKNFDPFFNPYSWKRNMEKWALKAKPRVCSNPRCRKVFQPHTPRQKYCCHTCQRAVLNKSGISIKRDCICSGCSRHTRYLIDGLCSFCQSRNKKLEQEIKKGALIKYDV